MTKSWKVAILGSVGAASLLCAPMAHAAGVIDYGAGVDPTSVTASFQAGFKGNNSTSPFTDSFTPFTLDTYGSLTGILSTTTSGLEFSLISVSPSTLSIPLFTGIGASFGGPVDIGPGTYQLTVSGGGVSPSAYGGTLSFAAVPEPGVWAMLLVGFGIIGFGMRRRKAEGSKPRIRVRYA